jgi:DNA-directed RNA polymerase specialized sigma24 family protein
MPFRRRKDYELSTLDDEDLLAYAVDARDAGERDAMGEALAVLAFRRWDNLVRRARLKVPADDAEDVAAKTFSDAALAAFEGRSEGEFWQLLSKVLARRIADYWKKRESSPDTTALPEEHADDEDIHGGPAAVTKDPTTAIPAQDVIDRRLGQLNESHRLVVELVVFEGYDAQSTADHVNQEHRDLTTPMSVDNVHKITSRFRGDLRRDLEDSG